MCTAETKQELCFLLGLASVHSKVKIIFSPLGNKSTRAVSAVRNTKTVCSNSEPIYEGI